MLTLEDLKKLERYFATKEDLHRLEEKIVTKEEFNPFKEHVLTALDKVLGEIKGLRQEWTFHRSEHNRIEKRLVNLEGKQK